MSAPAIEALCVDVRDLCGALHVLAEAAAQRGTEDERGALRLLARHAERIAERVEAMVEAARG